MSDLMSYYNAENSTCLMMKSMQNWQTSMQVTSPISTQGRRVVETPLTVCSKAFFARVFLILIESLRLKVQTFLFLFTSFVIMTNFI